MDAKKGLALLIMEHAKKKGALSSMKEAAPDEEEDTEDDGDAGVESAMEDFMSALKGDDVKAAIEAWKSLCELHGG